VKGCRRRPDSESMRRPALGQSRLHDEIGMIPPR
jgi:hypothetical protein